MMKGGVDVTVTEIDKAPPFTIFKDYNYYFRMTVVEEHSPYSFTFSSIIAVWLHDNVAPLTDRKWVVNSKGVPGDSVEICFKEEKDAAFFKLTWAGSQ